jgi:dipeptidyl aminopeptidase/acylaminoacyl peptidase
VEFLQAATKQSCSGLNRLGFKIANMQMRSLFLFVVFICSAPLAYSQGNAGMAQDGVGKPAVDTGVLDKWPVVATAGISHNGQYAWYVIFNLPVVRSLLVLRAVNGLWEMRFPGVWNAVFTDDDQSCLLINQHDSLCFITPGSSTVGYVAHVQDFKLSGKGKNEYLLYHLNTPASTLVVQQLLTGKVQHVDGVQEYVLHSNGNTLVVKTTDRSDRVAESLYWIDIREGKTTRLWTGDRAGNLVLDDAGRQLAFAEERNTGMSFWYYRAGTSAAVRVDWQTNGTDSRLQPTGIQRFSKDGKRLFVQLMAASPARSGSPANAVNVDVWSYQDARLQSQQLSESGASPYYTALLDMSNARLVRLQQENEKIQLTGRDDIAFITQTKGGAEGEWYWNIASRPSFFIVSTYTGEKKELALNYPGLLSPNGRYVIGSGSPVNGMWNEVICYDLETNEYHAISAAIPAADNEQEINVASTLKHRGLSPVAWLLDSKGLLITDGYDMWLADPLGKKAPVSVTNGYGRRHHIVFRLPYDPFRVLTGSDTLIVTAFNKANKQSGFYRLVLGTKQADPELLSMEEVAVDLYTAPLKARDAAVWLVMRRSTAMAPNYFMTTDFTSFHPISDNHPEKAYNWMTAELITWKSPAGTMLQGALYKPENFDPSKKYPVIFDCYEERSDELNEFKYPGASTGRINIAWYVSNGYLVCTPDIRYTTGHPGESACNAVVSAAQYLSAMPWVDAGHMGIQGHSFGGYEINYIVTHTNLFAAAMAASGISNLVSDYGSLFPNGGSSKQYLVETDQYRIGCTMWEQPGIYIENSPIFRADKVTTPLLLMNNKKDGAVPFAQGVEFFTALRRLGKKVWMLQYDDGAHSVYPLSKEAMDYHIRMAQFFDHYLKGKPAPRWMTRGIAANRKGVDDGLQLDDEIATPGPGLFNGNMLFTRYSHYRR